MQQRNEAASTKTDLRYLFPFVVLADFFMQQHISMHIII